MESKLVKYKKAIIVVVLVVVVGLVVLGLVESQKFHVVSTDPGTSSVSVISPFFKINFNKQLVTSGLSVTASSGIISNYQVQNKSIVIDLRTPITLNQSYSITVSGVADTKGIRLSNLVFNFVAKDIPFQKLSADQQSTILKKQTGSKNSLSSVVYSGTSSLLNAGVSSAQISELEVDFIKFQPSAKTIIISPNGIEVYKNNSADAISFSVNFSVTIDGVSYNAVGTYSDINDISLVLNNPQTGSSAFNSNN